jgi:hypothetical protein
LTTMIGRVKSADDAEKRVLCLTNRVRLRVTWSSVFNDDDRAICVELLNLLKVGKEALVEDIFAV